MQDGANEIVSGSIAGGVGKIFEYPFDTVKVRLQSQSLSKPQYKGAWDCLIKGLKLEGIRGLYKGVSTPIVAAAAENATLFLSYSMFDKQLNSSISNQTVRALVCGSLSGLAASFVLTPIELVKCQIQVDASSPKARVWPVIRHNFEMYGLSGFWRGHLGTALREAGGSAAWFGTYYALRDDFGPLLAGAAAGIGYNLSLFPADSIKSRIQTRASLGKENSMSFLQTGKQIIEQQGIKGLYRGSLVTCLRAGPSNAVIFGVHERVRNYLN